MKNDKGFTIVEVVVVAVIMAILAAVAIPIYTGYISSQRQSTVNNLWESAAAAANAEYRRAGALADDADVTPQTAPLNLYFNGAKYTIAIAGATITVTEDGTSFSKSADYR